VTRVTVTRIDAELCVTTAVRTRRRPLAAPDTLKRQEQAEGRRQLDQDGQTRNPL
jgi:hypothetical protein